MDTTQPASTTPIDAVTAARTEASKRVPRVRMAPLDRVQQILDQALIEFSQRGFEAARMDDIARRCALSKGGLYAHFDSKDQLFEALLVRSITPPDLKKMPLRRPVKVRPLIKWVVDQLYDSLAHPRTLTTMRLLIAEGARVPHLVKLWNQQMVEPHMALLGEVLRESTSAQGGRRSIIVREPWLAAAPALHAMLGQLVLGEHETIDLARFRKAHVQMLCELLEPLVSPVPPKGHDATGAVAPRRR